MQHAKIVFEKAGIHVQTLRLATSSFTTYMPQDAFLNAAQTLMLHAHGEGIDYVSIGPSLAQDTFAIKAIPGILAGTKDLFASALTTTPKGEVCLPAIQACAETIKANSSIEKNGFGNLRFAALANVRPFGPFFPAAYGEGWENGFALALEAANLAVNAFTSAKSLQEARQKLIDEIELKANILTKISQELQNIYQIPFKGMDFTLAPFPQKNLSIGTALEALGVPAVGMHGSLTAAAFLTDTLDQAKFLRCGFNGLMLPVLEDSTLAQRAAEGTLNVSDLLLYSTVCGTGLDVIPLPGETSVEQLYSILLDLSTLSLRLNKPLTARLMPLPGKMTGDPTEFDFAYFAPSRVMSINAQPLSGLLVGKENLSISSRCNHELIGKE